ncbi:efflux RND transporter periplasmic adaptor subunit [Vibrio agarivorans]|uniref:efflux RND transporter periplasmic adaptor subunit n=1 Tax=Vibrio agarivorans TaxID=153622 RepID=UPI0025B37F32|nr:efflux RND transporter periplasmic adaptor subunit [Vibrio agarivorans]MDN3660205.1 efflux RND transporter periplasmic adaptor subunit [Vibrio agarivorans]
MKSQSKNTLVAIAVAGILVGCSDEAVTAADKTPRPVNVIELGHHDNSYQQYFAGRLESVDEANVAFRVPGTVEEIYVATGDVVSKGDKLAQLDSHDYQVALMELQARLSEAESAFRLANSELRRVKQAISENAIAKVNLDRARSGYERSKAAVDVVKQNIKKAEDAIRYTTLVSPFDGVVGQQNTEQFEQVLPGVPVFQIHKPSKLQAVVDVPESLINRFGYGQNAQISWHGAEDKISAKTSEISTVPHPIKQTYSVVFELASNDASVLPGKAVIVEAEFANPSGVYCLPYSSMTKRNDFQNVFVVDNGKAVLKTVEVQHLLGDDICVTGALDAGDQVIISGVGTMKSGQAVGEIITAQAK